jgi:hypothetical protein
MQKLDDDYKALPAEKLKQVLADLRTIERHAQSRQALVRRELKHRRRAQA